MKTAITVLCIGIGLAITAIVRGRKITPDTIVLAVKMTGKPWQRCICCIRDAQHDGYRYAAISSRHIVDLQTMKRTGRKFKEFGSENHS